MNASRRGAFTLVELLVTLGVIALLLSIMLPALRGARAAARVTRCLSQQRQLVIAWTAYAGDHHDRAMPLARFELEHIGTGEQVFWWGSHGTTTTPPDPARGILAPYLDDSLREGSVFECPDQPWGSYRAQGPGRRWLTSTYGYNGYYLSPAHTPGWASDIGHRPWRRLSDLQRPDALLVFADTLLPLGPRVGNTALLDPPMLFSRAGGWRLNPSPTTAFRHARGDHGAGSAVAAHADASARSVPAQPDWITHPEAGIGSVGTQPGPSYVPDWRSWESDAGVR